MEDQYMRKGFKRHEALQAQIAVIHIPDLASFLQGFLDTIAQS